MQYPDGKLWANAIGEMSFKEISRRHLAFVLTPLSAESAVKSETPSH